MLRHVMGEKAFEEGLRSYMSLPTKKSDFNAFVNSLSHAAKYDLRPFLRPWIQGKNIPDLQTHVETGKLTVMQKGELFNFPLEIELLTANGKFVAS